MLKNLIRVKELIFNYLYRAYLFRNGEVKVGVRFIIKGLSYCRNEGLIKFGDDVKINSGVRNNPVTGIGKCVFITRKNGIIDIGNNVGISNVTIFSVRHIKINDNTIIGSGTCIWDTDFHSVDYNDRLMEGDKGISKEVIIGKNNFIGANVIILKGTTIGDNVTIGAGSVISGHIPDNQVWAGNPAKRIK
ncbi:TPA: acyltransferase [Photobacterium damselae]